MPNYDDEPQDASAAQIAAQTAAAYTAYGAQSAASGFASTRNQPAAQPGQLDRGFGMWAQDFDEQLSKLELDLLGIRMAYDKAEKKWKAVPFGKPTLNEQGVAAVMMFLRTLISKNTYFSNYTAATVHQKTRANVRAINLMLAKHEKEFGIRDPADTRTVVVLCDSLIESAYRQAMDNGARNWFQRFISEVFQKTETPPQKTGLLSRLKPW